MKKLTLFGLLILNIAYFRQILAEDSSMTDYILYRAGDKEKEPINLIKLKGKLTSKDYKITKKRDTKLVNFRSAFCDDLLLNYVDEEEENVELEVKFEDNENLYIFCANRRDIFNVFLGSRHSEEEKIRLIKMKSLIGRKFKID